MPVINNVYYASATSPAAQRALASGGVVTDSVVRNTTPSSSSSSTLSSLQSLASGGSTSSSSTISPTRTISTSPTTPTSTTTRTTSTSTPSISQQIQTAQGSGQSVNVSASLELGRIVLNQPSTPTGTQSNTRPTTPTTPTTPTIPPVQPTQPVTTPVTTPVQVNPNGQAPGGLTVGTVVKTAGGDYRITAVNPDGTYKSELVQGTQPQQPTTPVVPTTQQEQPKVDINTDPHIIEYKKMYAEAQARNDIQGMINASTLADQYRTSKGYPAENVAHIQYLQGERQKKITDTINGFKYQHDQAELKGDYVGMLDAAEKADDFRASAGLPRENTAYIAYLKGKIKEQNEEVGVDNDVDYFKDIVKGKFEEMGQGKEDDEAKIREWIEKLRQADESAINTEYMEKDQSLAKQLRDIMNAYSKEEGALNQQKSENLLKFMEKRNSTDAMNLQNINKLQEILASTGLFHSGRNATETSRQLAQREGDINSINRDESNFLTDITRKLADALRERTSDEVDVAEKRALNTRGKAEAISANTKKSEAEIIKQLLENKYHYDDLDMDLLNSAANMYGTSLDWKKWNKEFAQKQKMDDSELRLNEAQIEELRQSTIGRQVDNDLKKLGLTPGTPEYNQRFLASDKIRAEIANINKSTATMGKTKGSSSSGGGYTSTRVESYADKAKKELINELTKVNPQTKELYVTIPGSVENKKFLDTLKGWGLKDSEITEIYNNLVP